MKSIQLLGIPEVRVSTAAFAVIKDDKGRYALTANPNRSYFVFTPIGGGLEVSEEGIVELKKILNVNKDTFEKGNDLRFIMNGSKAEVYKRWFLLGKNRDLTPEREIKEELIDEIKLLKKEDFEGIHFEKLGYGAELSGGTRRIGQEGKITLRILEVFDTKLKPEVIDKLISSSKKDGAYIRFITKEEILNGQTKDGVKIATNVARFLFEYEQEIPEFV